MGREPTPPQMLQAVRLAMVAQPGKCQASSLQQKGIRCPAELARGHTKIIFPFINLINKSEYCHSLHITVYPANENLMSSPLSPECP